MMSLLAMLFAVFYDRLGRRPAPRVPRARHWVAQRLTPSPAPRRARLISGGRVLGAALAGYAVAWGFQTGMKLPITRAVLDRPWGEDDDPSTHR